MLLRRSTLVALFSDMRQRIQRLEAEQAQLRARIELGRMTLEFWSAAHAATAIGSALEGFATGMRRPLKRGRSGGLARAHQASLLRERWSDGRYMAHEDSEQIEREVAEAEYMRYAAGGFARAASAKRAEDGTFV